MLATRTSSRMFAVIPSVPSPTRTPWRASSGPGRPRPRCSCSTAGCAPPGCRCSGEGRSRRSSHARSGRRSTSPQPPARLRRRTTRWLYRFSFSAWSAASSATCTWMPVSSSFAASTDSRSVSSPTVKRAWRPNIPATRPSPFAWEAFAFRTKRTFSSIPSLPFPYRSETPRQRQPRTPVRRRASSIGSRQPSCQPWLSWWSMIVVVPPRMQSRSGTSALYEMSSFSSARSSGHQSRSRIWTKFAGGCFGESPRAKVE